MYQRPMRFNFLPEVIKNLLIINGLFFVATFVLGNVINIDLIRTLGLYLPISDAFEPYQIVTHMFMHANLGHVFFNMFALWMFGYTLENVWGSKRFLIYYMVTGLGAALLHMGVNYWEWTGIASQISDTQLQIVLNEGQQLLMNNQNYTDPIMGKANLLLHTPTVGASGAVYGVLLAFGMMFPNQQIYIYFLFPIKAKYFVIIFGALELFSGIANDPDSNVAHFAHLGGMLFGYLLIRYWRSKGGLYQ